jgi:hypothetical protein
VTLDLQEEPWFELVEGGLSRSLDLKAGDVKPGDVLSYEYGLKPKYPLKAKAPSAVAYEYYTPANRAASRPVELTVDGGGQEMK